MKFLLSLIFTLYISSSLAQKKYDVILKSIETNVSEYKNIANQIWSFAEMGYQEEKSSALLQKTLFEEGFSVETKVANIPTAFIASYGSGSPVIAILGFCFRYFLKKASINFTFSLINFLFILFATLLIGI